MQLMRRAVDEVETITTVVPPQALAPREREITDARKGGHFEILARDEALASGVHASVRRHDPTPRVAGLPAAVVRPGSFVPRQRDHHGSPSLPGVPSHGIVT